jgi:hypothetical protein
MPKPEPLTVTDVPGGPLEGLNVIAGVTVNDAEASTEPPDGTSALMLYVPAATEGMVRVAVNVPEADAVTDADGSPGSTALLPFVSNQTTPEAPTLKPEPVTVIDVPGEPLPGDMLIDGDGTVNVAEASTDPPDGTSALMLYVPAATEGMVRVAVNVPEADAVTET